MQCNVVETITEEICVESLTVYRNDQPDGLRESCAEDERRAEKPETPLHLRKRTERIHSHRTSGNTQIISKGSGGLVMSIAFIKLDISNFPKDEK